MVQIEALPAGTGCGPKWWSMSESGDGSVPNRFKCNSITLTTLGQEFPAGFTPARQGGPMMRPGDNTEGLWFKSSVRRLLLSGGFVRVLNQLKPKVVSKFIERRHVQIAATVDKVAEDGLRDPEILRHSVLSQAEVTDRCTELLGKIGHFSRLGENKHRTTFQANRLLSLWRFPSAGHFENISLMRFTVNISCVRYTLHGIRLIGNVSGKELFLLLED